MEIDKIVTNKVNHVKTVKGLDTLPNDCTCLGELDTNFISSEDRGEDMSKKDAISGLIWFAPISILPSKTCVKGSIC